MLQGPRSRALRAARARLVRVGGLLWRVKPAPSPDAINYLVAATALSGSDVWAVGSHTSATDCPCVVYPLAEHWDGHSWTPISPDGVGGAGSTRLNGVARIPGSSDVWAVGDSFHNTPGIQSPTGSTPERGRRCRFPTRQRVVRDAERGRHPRGRRRLGGGQLRHPSGGTHPLALHWDGAAWRQLDTSALASGGELRGAAYLNGHTLYAVGDTTSFGQPYQPLLLKLTAARARLEPSR